MAFEYLRLGFMKLEEQQLHDALHFLTKAHFQATEAVHTATSFQCLLKAVKMKLTSYTLMEAAVELDGNLKYYWDKHVKLSNNFKESSVSSLFIAFQKENWKTSETASNLDWKQ